jgi:hypothetical protein
VKLEVQKPQPKSEILKTKGYAMYLAKPQRALSFKIYLLQFTEPFFAGFAA